jgi:hypothetical protein
MMIGNGASEDMVSGWTVLAGVIWSLTLSLFLLFNRDRMRMGDLIAGTWVVMAQRAKLDSDIAATQDAQAILFSDAELSVYGIFELQELNVSCAAAMRGRCARLPTRSAPRSAGPLPKRMTSFCFPITGSSARPERGLLFGKDERTNMPANDAPSASPVGLSVTDALHQRRSVRAFTGEAVDPAILKTVLPTRSARRRAAISSHGRRPY